jgi:hypothetical protein
MRIDDTARCPRKAMLELFGMASSQFHQLARLGVLKQAAKGAYDLPASIQGWANYHRDGQTADTITEERKKLIVAQRRQIEQRTRVEAGEQVLLDDARQAFDAALVMVATQMDALPGRLAGELAGMSDPAEIRSILMHEVRRVRDSAATQLQDWAADKQRSSPAEAAAAEDS